MQLKYYRISECTTPVPVIAHCQAADQARSPSRKFPVGPISAADVHDPGQLALLTTPPSIKPTLLDHPQLLSGDVQVHYFNMDVRVPPAELLLLMAVCPYQSAIAEVQ